MSLSAGSTIARASSGSRSSIKSIEPLISANSAVTVLRSPSTTSSGGTTSLSRTCPLLGAENVSGMESELPHSPQKLSPSWMGAPHLGHEATRAVPQVVQNLRPSRLSLPHFEQRILPHSGCDGFRPVRLCRLLGRVEAFREPVVGVTALRWSHCAACLTMSLRGSSRRATLSITQGCDQVAAA